MHISGRVSFVCVFTRVLYARRVYRSAIAAPGPLKSTCVASIRSDSDDGETLLTTTVQSRLGGLSSSQKAPPGTPPRYAQYSVTYRVSYDGFGAFASPLLPHFSSADLPRPVYVTRFAWFWTGDFLAVDRGPRDDRATKPMWIRNETSVRVKRAVVTIMHGNLPSDAPPPKSTRISFQRSEFRNALTNYNHLCGAGFPGVFYGFFRFIFLANP